LLSLERTIGKILLVAINLFRLVSEKNTLGDELSSIKEQRNGLDDKLTVLTGQIQKYKEAFQENVKGIIDQKVIIT
jgi:hypothetical protein